MYAAGGIIEASRRKDDPEDTRDGCKVRAEAVGHQEGYKTAVYLELDSEIILQLIKGTTSLVDLGCLTEERSFHGVPQ